MGFNSARLLVHRAGVVFSGGFAPPAGLAIVQEGCSMPCIQTKTNRKLTAAQEDLLKVKFGKAIELLPGKSKPG